LKTKLVQIGDDKIKLQIWDTAGMENHRSLPKNLIQDVNGVVLVFSLTDLGTFNHVTEWLEYIKRQFRENIDIILIGNKNDLLAD
jgi:small GTP-binding protein